MGIYGIMLLKGRIDMRKHFIDNLRWGAVLMLIPYHAAQAFNTWGEPNYVSFEGSRAICSVIVFMSPWYMPLLFLLAGISTRYSLQKRSRSQYLTERLKRLGVPLVFGMLTFVPAMTYIAEKSRGTFEGGFFEHYSVFFTKLTDWTGADGGFSMGQFWFLLYLLVISSAAVGITTLQKKLTDRPAPVLPFPAVILLGAPLPLLSEVLSVGGKSLAEFLYIFLVGYYVFSDDRIIEKAAKYRFITLPAGIIAGIADVYLFVWTGTEYPALNTAAKFVCEWCMVLGLMGLGKKRLDLSNKFTAHMSSRSMSFFGYHFIWVVLFQYLMAGAFEGNTALLYFVPEAAAYAATFICCEITARLPVLGFLMGERYRKREETTHRQ